MGDEKEGVSRYANNEQRGMLLREQKLFHGVGLCG